MTYLYHVVPLDMRGTVLYPLNALKEVHWDLYLAKVAKYEGREELLKVRVPTLECLWNDVLFLSAIGPETFRKAFDAAGITYPLPLRCFRLDASALNPARMTVMTRAGFRAPRLFEPFDANNINKYALIPPATISHWQEAQALGRQILRWLYAPHIMYKGTIDVSNVPIVET